LLSAAPVRLESLTYVAYDARPARSGQRLPRLRLRYFPCLLDQPAHLGRRQPDLFGLLLLPRAEDGQRAPLEGILLVPLKERDRARRVGCVEQQLPLLLLLVSGQHERD